MAEGFTVTRVFDAPREMVFRAWTTPARFAGWFGLPGFTTPPDRVVMDVRPGGAWEVVLVPHGAAGAPGAGGDEVRMCGLFRDVIEPERVVFTFDRTELITVTLTDLGARTEMVFHQGGGGLTAEEYEQARRSWAGIFDQLTTRLGV
ncbi:SRPBCC domain-containing protein [Streptomyces sp. SBT349]|uniref:SRPBCC domain-containing protein n=1 Tax=Streptomyces sp. SBT349 TaxID=1580539 RepID=UPI00066B79E0|nr:SRPBCC domain-containing protein [Streptomyces sp. SBT349]